MKTIEEIINETGITFYSKEKQAIINAMQEYAKKCCDLQIEAVANEFSPGYEYRKIILSTPNVVTTNTK